MRILHIIKETILRSYQQIGNAVFVPIHDGRAGCVAGVVPNGDVQRRIAPLGFTGSLDRAEVTLIRKIIKNKSNLSDIILSIFNFPDIF